MHWTVRATRADCIGLPSHMAPAGASYRKGIAVIKVVEKKNPLAVHGLFDTVERAEKHLRETIPVYVARGYFMDKTLRADNFEIKLPK